MNEQTLEGWVIIGVRPGVTYPTMISNLANETNAKVQAKALLAQGLFTAIIAVCPAFRLRSVAQNVFSSDNIDKDRSCCECGESYVCDLNPNSGDDPVFCPKCHEKEVARLSARRP